MVRLCYYFFSPASGKLRAETTPSLIGFALKLLSHVRSSTDFHGVQLKTATAIRDIMVNYNINYSISNAIFS
jgi:hypothetical protein